LNVFPQLAVRIAHVIDPPFEPLVLIGEFPDFFDQLLILFLKILSARLELLEATADFTLLDWCQIVVSLL
jgi:hypothetical protein